MAWWSFIPAAISGVQALSANQQGNKPPKAVSILDKLARQYYGETEPLYGAAIDRSTDFLNGNMDVAQSPMFGALKAQIEPGYQSSRDNAIAQTAPGGALMDRLASVEGQRAGALSGGISDLISAELDRAFTLGMSGVDPTGLHTAAGTQAQNAMNQSMIQGEAKQGLGQGLGYLGGSYYANQNKPTTTP